MGLKVIITGATGMVGEGVLLECLDNPQVSEVVVINRKPGGRNHAKLKEIIHKDFFNLTPIQDQLKGYDACFFCLGISAVGISKDEYKRITYDLTMHVGQVLSRINPDLVFCYITGAGTDSSEQSKLAWARVKGATENALLKLFKDAYMFRPGFMKTSPDQRNAKSFYKFVAWMYPLGRRVFPGGFCTIREVALAMINAVSKGNSKKVLEVKDIVKLAKA